MTGSFSTRHWQCSRCGNFFLSPEAFASETTHALRLCAVCAAQSFWIVCGAVGDPHKVCQKPSGHVDMHSDGMTSWLNFPAPSSPIAGGTIVIAPEAPIDAQAAIAAECDAIKAMLLEKNRKYGSSALEPLRIFSKADPVEQILVRLDDKLSRLRSAQGDDKEDVVQDLIGYLILLRVAKRLK